MCTVCSLLEVREDGGIEMRNYIEDGTNRVYSGAHRYTPEGQALFPNAEKAEYAKISEKYVALLLSSYSSQRKETVTPEPAREEMPNLESLVSKTL